MAISSQTFPGVYTKVIDSSFLTPSASRFKAGLVGPAQKGPFNIATSVRSLKEFARIFGKSLDNSYLANAASILTKFSDGCTVVRVGAQYDEIATGGSGVVGNVDVYVANPALFAVNDRVRVSQLGKITTANALVSEIDSNRIHLSASTPLADNYTSASVDKAAVANAANEAESFGYSYAYGSALSGITISGDKNGYSFTMSGTVGNLSAARTALAAANVLIKITEANKKTTRELRIKEVRADNVVKLETTNNSKNGYQQLALQDSYVAASVSLAGGLSKTVHMYAASAGTWANSDGIKTGLIVNVGPGSAPDTKKLLVYQDSALIETIDNLSDDPASTDYYETRINGLSSGIVLYVLDSSTFTHLANTTKPWDTTNYSTTNFAYFTGGDNGESVTAADYVGQINPADESGTGIKAFEDPDNIDVNVLWASPIVSNGSGQGTDNAVAQQLKDTASVINAVGIIDSPQGLNALETVDWHNAKGLYSSLVRLDTFRLALYWNWWTSVDAWTGLDKVLPPSIAAMRAMAYTFDNFKPWYVAAGETRGIVSEADSVEFTRIGPDTRNAMQGNGNSVNPLMINRDRIMIYGERTLQRTESKLTALHSVVLTNYIMTGLAAIGRQFVFDPNDAELLNRLNLAMTAFLEGVKAERGIEEFLLVMDNTNNNADTRNQREVIIDLSYVPVDAAERIFINGTVKSSGANLNSAL